MLDTDNDEIFLRNDGYCVICESATTFEARAEWLRGSFKCIKCNSIPRQRALVYFLNRIRPHWRDLDIHESSPTLGFFAERCSKYSSSFFFEDVELGSDHNGKRCENLEAMTFADETFDIFITQDVLEHVFDPPQALSEISRVLREGGMHIFTAPKNSRRLISRRRAELINGEIVYLEKPEYHGNPISEEGALVTWDYGTDFDRLLCQWSGYQTSCYILRDRFLGIDGELLEVFVTEKRAVNRTMV